MAMLFTPAVIQPAYNELEFVDALNGELGVSQAGNAYPSPKTYVLKRVPQNYHGTDARVFDVSGVVRSFFRDLRVEIMRFVYHDYNLKAEYVAGDGSNRLALNAVRQYGETLDLYAETKVGALRTYAEEVSPGVYNIPAYEGFPVGATIMAKHEYELELDMVDAFEFTVQGDAGRTSFGFTSAAGGTLIGLGSGATLTISPGQVTSIPVSGSESFAFLPAGEDDIMFRASASDARITSVDGWAGEVDGRYRVARYQFGDMSLLTNINGRTGEIGAGLATAAEMFIASAITSIPARLFSRNPALKNFTSTFNNCQNLIAIPPGLFAQQEAGTFAGCFYMCTALTSVPDWLMTVSDNAPASAFLQTFAYCSSLSAVGARVFNGAGAFTFSNTFASCGDATSGGLASLSEDVFTGTPNAVEFYRTFADTRLAGILPEGLFANNAAVTRFYYTFQNAGHGASAGLAIPAGLFANNPAVTSFNGTFAGANITSIPTTLFDNNLSAVDFRSTFYGIGAQLTGGTPRTNGTPLWGRSTFGQGGSGGGVSDVFETETYSDFRLGGVSNDGNRFLTYNASGATTELTIWTKTNGVWETETWTATWGWVRGAILSPDGAKIVGVRYQSNIAYVVFAKEDPTTHKFATGEVVAAPLSPSHGGIPSAFRMCTDMGNNGGAIVWYGNNLIGNSAYRFTAQWDYMSVFASETIPDRLATQGSCPYYVPDGRTASWQSAAGVSITIYDVDPLGGNRKTDTKDSADATKRVLWTGGDPSVIPATDESIVARSYGSGLTIRNVVDRISTEKLWGSDARASASGTRIVTAGADQGYIAARAYDRIEETKAPAAPLGEFDATKYVEVLQLQTNHGGLRLWGDQMALSENGQFAVVQYAGTVLNSATSIYGVKIIEFGGAVESPYPSDIQGTQCFYQDTALTDYAEIPNNWK